MDSWVASRINGWFRSWICLTPQVDFSGTTLKNFRAQAYATYFGRTVAKQPQELKTPPPKNSQNAPDKSLACPSNGWFAAFFFSAYFQTSMILKKILSVKSGRRLFLTVRWSGETLSSNMWKGRSTAMGSLWWGQTHQPNSRGVYIIHHKYYHYIYIYVYIYIYTLAIIYCIDHFF